MRNPQCCRPPTLTAVNVSAVAGKATVTPPPTLRPWKEYELTVCIKGTTDCTVLPLCTAVADKDAATDCAIPGRVASTTYTVTAVALLTDGTRSARSAAAEFTTSPYP